MNVFQKLWKRIVESDNQQYLDQITKYKQLYTDAVEELTKSSYEIEELEATIEDHEQTIKELETELSEASPPPVSELNMDYFFKEKKTRYTYKPGKRDYLHKTLENFSQDEEYISKYFAFMQTLGLKDHYVDVDKMVYDVTLKVQKYINKTLLDDYNSDLEAFNAREYWLTPREAFDYYVEDEKAGDCEDTSAFLYGCIMSVLVTYQYNDAMWRLIRADINFPVGHAIVVWLKENGVWACIESTYGESRFSSNWNRDKDMFKGVYTGFMNGHIFNESTEYDEKK